MFRNYFKTAYRNLIRNKSYSFINIAGLAVGIAVCLIIFLIISFETSFDNFHKDSAQIFRVLTENNDPDGTSHNSGVPFPTTDALKNDFPTATVFPVFAGYNEQILVLNADGTIHKKLKEENGIYHSTPEFFQVFNFPLIDGSALSLKDPNTILLTQATAEKYFGDYKLAMGRTIKLNNYRIYKITGIIRNPPANTDFQMHAVLSYSTIKPDYAKQDWRSTNSSHGMFMKVPAGVSESTLTRQLRAFIKRYRKPENKYENSMVAQSIDKIHYDEDSGNLLGRSISPKLIDMLKLIALFILVIACVNFINLSTAQAVNRSKEVGVRKVLGSNRTQLQLQFYCETIIIVLLSVALAIGITIAALPGINSILELALTFAVNTKLILFIVAIIIAVSITALAGFYPSIVLSRFNPINALKSKRTINNTKGISLRRGLVVFQFIIAQALIIGTLIIVQQMNYFMNQPLGFDKDAIVNVPFRPNNTGSKLTDYLRQQLLSVNGVQAVSFSSNTPVEDDNDMWTTFKF